MGKFKNILINRCLVFFVILFGYATPVYSCSTPVFRYALEMWTAYAYTVEVIHDGNLNNAQQQALDYLKSSSNAEVPVNLMVIETIADNSTDIDKKDLPFMILTFPKAHNIPGVIWQGELTTENVKRMVDSPSRRQVVENIRNGDAAVWLFLRSGNTEKDSKRFQILEEELRQLSKKMKLAESATDVAGNLLDIKIINTGVSFSLVKIDKNDPAEEIFIKILLGTEPDLNLFTNVPLAFPVFGQGRALYSLVGAGIKDKNIETACSSVIGWCSCTIKDDNPGTDLLLKADWNIAIGDSSWIKQEEIPEITGLSGFVSNEDEIDIKPEKEKVKIEKEVVIEAKKPTEGTSNNDNAETVIKTSMILESDVGTEDQNAFKSPLLINILIVMALLLIAIVTASFVLKRR